MFGLRGIAACAAALCLLLLGGSGVALADDARVTFIPAQPAAGNVVAGDACKPPCAQRRDDCCWPLDRCGRRYGRWEITAEGLVSCLPEPEGVLGTPVYGAGNQLTWDAVDWEDDFTFGGRLGVRYALVAQEWLEVKGAYYGKRDASASATGVFGFEPGFGAPAPGQMLNVSEAVPATLASEAEAWGAELNYVSEISCSGRFRWDALIGGRYVQFNELSTVDFAAAPVPGFAGPAFVHSDVENLFVGLQVGGVFHLDVNPRFELNGMLKVMGGNLRREATVNDQSIFAGGPHTSTSEDDEVVFGAELELGFKYRLSSRLAITGGYNFLFLDSILRGYDAMDFTASHSGAVQASQNTDQLLIHSLFLGLNVNF